MQIPTNQQHLLKIKSHIFINKYRQKQKKVTTQCKAPSDAIIDTTGNETKSGESIKEKKQ